MASLKLAVICCEFDFEDVLRYPVNSGVPRSRWKQLRMTGPAFLKRLWELQLEFPHVHFLYAGEHGREASSSLFKRAFEVYRPDMSPG
jgi:hypothetical protein